jgi:NADH-quinone oxidoreductase subunit G
VAKIRIDGQSYEVADGKNLLEICLSLGFDLPYFCWHPALGSVGACRQCAVKQFKNEKDTRGKIVMSCMTPASDETSISLLDPEAKAFRASVIEWLMINHPHDCPVCDEGGECHLQDMTVMTGHTYRRFRFKKRTFQNQNLGSFVNHEMNRCIACYRCVRFYRDYAGGRDLNVFASHDHVYFGRHEDGQLENEFSGNLVEVCPTGVFTDKTLKKHYTRKWDLQTAPSICAHCSLGCNTIPGERYGTLRRIRNRYHHEINGYFLCDRGRYGYEFVNSDRRIRDIWFREERKKPIEKTSSSHAIERLGNLLSAPHELSRTIGIGSPRASLEANFALRTLVGAERFYAGVSELDSELIHTTIQILKHGPVPSASLRDIEHADAILVLGENVTNTAPRLALAIRQSVANSLHTSSRQLKIPDWQDAAVREVIQDQKGPLFVAVPYRSSIDDIATQTYPLAPDDIARLGFAIAHALHESFPPVDHLSAEMARAANSIAQTLGMAKCPAVISGSGIRSKSVLEAAANVAWALQKRKTEVKLCLTLPESNSFGLGLMRGKPLSEAFKQGRAGTIDTLIILENDLFRRADSEILKAFFATVKRVVVLDHTATAMIPRADIILPSSTFAESDGTFVNYEGRAQRFFQVWVPNQKTEGASIQESWSWIRDLMLVIGCPEGAQWKNFDALSTSLSQELTDLSQITEAAPPASFRISGNKIARKSHRSSGRTAMFANVSVHDPKPPQDPDTPFSFSMEGFQGEPPAPLIPRYWAPGWNSVQSLNKFQTEVGGTLRGGSSGKRLIKPTSVESSFLFHTVPLPFSPKPGQWLAIPIHHIFGSEELSSLSPGIAELAPRPYVAINLRDATRLQIQDGDFVNFAMKGRSPLLLTARLESSLPPGIIGVPVGLSSLEGKDVNLPDWVELSHQTLAGAAS